MPYSTRRATISTRARTKATQYLQDSMVLRRPGALRCERETSGMQGQHSTVPRQPHIAAARLEAQRWGAGAVVVFHVFTIGYNYTN